MASSAPLDPLSSTSLSAPAPAAAQASSPKFYRTYGTSGKFTAEITLTQEQKDPAAKATQVFQDIKNKIIDSHSTLLTDDQRAKFKFSLNFDQPHLSFLIDDKGGRHSIDLTNPKYHSMAVGGKKIHDLVTSTAKELRSTIPFQRATVDAIGRAAGEKDASTALASSITKQSYKDFKAWAPILLKIAPTSNTERQEFIQNMHKAVQVNKAQIDLYTNRMRISESQYQDYIGAEKKISELQKELKDLENPPAAASGMATAATSTRTKGQIEREIKAQEEIKQGDQTSYDIYTSHKEKLEKAKDIDWLAIGLGFIHKNKKGEALIKAIEGTLKDSKIKKELVATSSKFKIFEKVDPEKIKDYALDVAALHTDTLLGKHEIYETARKELKVGSPALDLIVRGAKISESRDEYEIRRFCSIAGLANEGENKALNLFASKSEDTSSRDLYDQADKEFVEALYQNSTITAQQDLNDDSEFLQALENIPNDGGGLTISDPGTASSSSLSVPPKPATKVAQRPMTPMVASSSSVRASSVPKGPVSVTARAAPQGGRTLSGPAVTTVNPLIPAGSPATRLHEARLKSSGQRTLVSTASEVARRANGLFSSAIATTNPLQQAGSASPISNKGSLAGSRSGSTIQPLSLQVEGNVSSHTEFSVRRMRPLDLLTDDTQDLVATTNPLYPAAGKARRVATAAISPIPAPRAIPSKVRQSFNPLRTNSSDLRNHWLLDV